MKEKKPIKLNVLFLCSWYPDRINTTNGNFIIKHAQAVKEYCNITALHICTDPNLEENIEVLESSKNGFDEIIIYVKKTSIINKVILFYKAYRLGLNIAINKLDKIDLIHLNVIMPSGIMAVLWNFTRNIPYVISEHWTGYHNKNINYFHKIIARIITKKAEFVIPVTKNLAKSMQSLKFNGEYTIIPNVVDTNLFTPDPTNHPIKFKYIHISTLNDEHKNISGILRTLKKMQEQNLDFELHIISEGNQDKFKSYMKEISLASKHVVFHGEKKTYEVAKIMKECNALLLFSNYENLPCVIVEALACGLPIISTDVGGISEHIDQEKGILIEKGNEDELLKAMNLLIYNYTNYDKNKLRKYAIDNFSYEVIGKSFDSIYKKSIK